MSAPFGRFFLPGPTEVQPEILAAQDRPMMGHRGAATQEIAASAHALAQAADRLMGAVRSFRLGTDP